MLTRRSFLATTSIATTAALISAGHAAEDGAASTETASMEMRAIPATGEKLPVIGLGTSGNFEIDPSSPEYGALREVLKLFFEGGGAVIDTAPTYSVAEDNLGALLAEMNARPKSWIATKLSGVRGREAGLAQFNELLRRLKTDKVELLQVHNLIDVETQLAVARDLKADGKTRYVGVTHYQEQAQDALADIVKANKPDFLQINYSIVARGAEKRLLPMAQELGVAVLINRAFEDGKLFARVKNVPLPAWTAEAGIASWAQAFLRFALSYPAVTVVIPATGKPKHQIDNLRAGRGPRLTDEQRKSLIDILA